MPSRTEGSPRIFFAGFRSIKDKNDTIETQKRWKNENVILKTFRFSFRVGLFSSIFLLKKFVGIHQVSKP